jgi:DNA-binding GntR family transcriptional regulator
MTRTADGIASPTTKADVVCAALRAELVHGHWAFGETLSTYALAERFGVSRRPVLDAMQRLETAGFVDIIPQVGCRVVVPEQSRVRDYLEMSPLFQGAAVARVAATATADDVAYLAGIHHRLGPTVDAQDFDEYQRAHRAFHSGILTLAGNRRLAVLAEEATDLWEFFFHPYRQSWPLEVLRSRLDDHSAILEAIRVGDPDVARGQMEQHLDPEAAMQVMSSAAPDPGV